MCAWRKPFPVNISQQIVQIGRKSEREWLISGVRAATGAGDHKHVEEIYVRTTTDIAACYYEESYHGTAGTFSWAGHAP